MTARIVTDELESIARMLCERYPDRHDDEIAALVRRVYERLAARAKVADHLIPLTLNHCLRVLEKHRSSVRPVDEGLKAIDSMTVAS
jgi:hypothetical protein